MLKFSVFALVTTAFLAVSASAGTPSMPTVPGGTGRAISFDELKDRCVHPEQFDVQRAPQNIRLQCQDVSVGWVAAAPGEVPLPGRRVVTSGVFSDKFFVNANQKEVPIFSKSGSCHRFREVENTMTIERSLSCDEIVGIKGDVTDFCATMLESSKSANPKLIETRETGNSIDTCGGPSIQHGNGKPGPK